MTRKQFNIILAAGQYGKEFNKVWRSVSQNWTQEERDNRYATVYRVYLFGRENASDYSVIDDAIFYGQMADFSVLDREEALFREVTA